MPILVKKLISWYALPAPQGETASSMILGIDIAVGGQDPDTEPGHRAQPQSSGSKRDKDKRSTRKKEKKTIPSHRAQLQATGHRAQPQRTRGQEEDKAWTQSPATKPSHRVQGRGQSVASSFFLR